MKAPYFLPLRSNCWPFFSIVLLRRGRQAFRIRTVILLLCHNLPLNSLRINKAKQLCVRSGRKTAMHRSSHIWPYFMYNADFRRRTNGTWTGDTNNKVLFTANYCVQARDEETNASRKRIEFISVDFGMAKRCPHIPLFCERNKKILSICLHQRLKGFTKIKTNCTFTISYRTMLGDGFFFGLWLANDCGYFLLLRRPIWCVGICVGSPPASRFTTIRRWWWCTQSIYQRVAKWCGHGDDIWWVIAFSSCSVSFSFLFLCDCGFS